MLTMVDTFDEDKNAKLAETAQLMTAVIHAPTRAIHDTTVTPVKEAVLAHARTLPIIYNEFD